MCGKMCIVPMWFGKTHADRQCYVLSSCIRGGKEALDHSLGGWCVGVMGRIGWIKGICVVLA